MSWKSSREEMEGILRCVQDLARYVAGRWPVQAQPSKQIKATAEGRQPTEAAHSLASIHTTLAGLVRDVLAAENSASQPLLDVRDLQPHALLPFKEHLP